MQYWNKAPFWEFWNRHVMHVLAGVRSPAAIVLTTSIQKGCCFEIYAR